MNNSGIKTKTKTTKTDAGGRLAFLLLLTPFVKQHCHLLERRSKPDRIFASSLNEVFISASSRQCKLLGCSRGKEEKGERIKGCFHSQLTEESVVYFNPDFLLSPVLPRITFSTSVFVLLLLHTLCAHAPFVGLLKGKKCTL